MKTPIPHSLLWQDADPYAALVGAVDRACMAFYAHMRNNARRIARIALVMLPLIVLLVGSCKTSQLPGAYGGAPGDTGGAGQFRNALFPDRVNFQGMDYYPAEGYIARARKFVSGTPENLTRLTAEEISWLFGKPAMTRIDAAARVWQYRADTCVVDFYFYDAKGKAAATEDETIAYVDVRLNGAVEEDLPDRVRGKCLDRVIDKGDFSSSRA